MLDPHTGTYNMNITGNWLHHNPIGAICSLDCYNIVIEKNVVEHNKDYGIFFSRNTSDSIARNNYILNTTIGIMVSESPNNQIHNNVIESAHQGIRLQNPEEPDDGSTEDNLVYNNSIVNAAEGIGAAGSHDNILQNNTLSNITSAEYMLSGNSDITIRGQTFDNVTIAEEGSETNTLQIVDSGIIQITERADDDDDEESEVASYNTDNQPYRKTVSNDETVTLSSAQSATTPDPI